MTTPTMAWTKLVHRLGPGDNPLRRRSDLIEAWLLPVAAAAFLVLAPLVAWAAVLWVHADAAPAEHAARSWHEVPAVLLHATPGPMMSDSASDSWVVWTLASWTADGQRHVAKVPAAAGISAGSTVPVWLNRAGHVQPLPLTASQVSDRVDIVVAAVLSVLAVVLSCLAMAGRSLLNRKRLAAWEAAWLAVGPQWSRQG